MKVASNSSLNKMKNVIVIQDDTNDDRQKKHSEPNTSKAARVKKSLTCGICFEPKPLSDLLFMKSCSHSFCSRCVAEYVSSKVEENVAEIVCPHSDCKSGMLEPDFCKPILAREVFDRWCDVLCECAIKLKFYCPFKDCSALLVDERGEEVIREAECPHCHRLFCAQCRSSWHPEMACEDFQMLGKNERERGDLLLMDLAKEKEWRRCPACCFYVEKISGCLFLRCRNFRFKPVDFTFSVEKEKYINTKAQGMGSQQQPRMTSQSFQKLGKNERDSGDLLLMNLAEKEGWKRCPACRFYVERLWGCPFIRCR
ncbi:hypothetical protein AXF42_Ash016223 [Apostasia shenzhenica]|uniref:RBR-type E3 ubiquitin transferase n=1 Tax=Apostasia shenzhenica TaxID=1088818 RepID=A0A2I0AET9_9ASPA|nr:hypothetical protein AXF42_Ash016223 [Apostasia shenzhenica]